MVSVFADRFMHLDEKNQFTFEMNSASWKVSELLYEAGQTTAAFRDYADGRVQQDTVQHHIRLLMGHVESFEADLGKEHDHYLEETSAHLNEEMMDHVSAVHDWLNAIDPAIFSMSYIEPGVALELRSQLQDLASDIRVSWAETHLIDKRGLLAEAMDEVHSHDIRLDVTIIGCVICLFVYFVIELQSSTRAQKREEKLKQAALEGSRTKTNFLSNISHEIRTPLNGILGMVEGLKDTNLQPEQRESLMVIENSSSVLLETMNNVLEIAQLEAGSSILRNIPFDLLVLVRDIVDAFTDVAKKKGLQVTLTCAPDVPSYVYGDPYRYTTVARHLISNAIKYTSVGDVRIELSCEEGPTPHDPLIVLSVEDTGIGIDIAYTDSIFEPFNQVDNTMTRDYTGAGLGLALARQVSWIMGGQLDVQSRLGEGSRFTCRIPFRMAREGALVEQPSASAIRQSVLGSSIAGTEFYEDALPPATDRAPLDFDHKGLNVLIVDDSRTNRMVLKRLLNGVDAELYEAENGEAAVSDFRDHQFDVVLMDIQMPVLDGIEAVRRIRKLEMDEGRKKSKIYAVTANVMPQQVKEYFEVGMDDVLPKPIKKTDIIDRIKQVPV